MKPQVNARQQGNIIPSELLRRLRRKGLQYGLSDIIPFPVQHIQTNYWVNLKCRFGCNRYNTSWCCPPATPDTDEAKKILSEYHNALLLVGRQRRPEFYRNNTRKRVKQVKIWKGSVALERMLFLEGYYKAFGLVSENCGLCRECAYPDPCRFPQEKRPLVESFSINMMETLHNIGITPKVATETSQMISYYNIILVD